MMKLFKYDPENPRAFSSTILIIVVLVMFLALIVTSHFYKPKNKSKDANKPAPTTQGVTKNNDSKITDLTKTYNGSGGTLPNNTTEKPTPGNTEQNPAGTDPSSADHEFAATITTDGEMPSGELFIAIAKNDLSEVKKIITKNKSLATTVDKGMGATPLQYAVLRGNIGIVNYLLSNGADVNSGGRSTKSPLSLAAYNGNLAIVKILIKNKANLNSKDKKNATPLIIACGRGKSGVALEILKYNIDLNVKEKDHGFSALHTAVMAGLTSVVKKMIGKGANKNIKNNDGLTPLDLAKTMGNAEMVKVLSQ